MKKQIAVVLFVVFALLSVNAQSKWSVGINGGASIPLATYGDIVKTGFGGFGQAQYQISENISLGLKAGYLSWALDADEINEFLKSNGQPEVDADFTNVPVLVSAKYFLSKGSFSPYTNLELGLHFLSVEAVVPNFITGDVETQSDSKTSFGYGVGLGTLIELSQKVHLDINATLAGNGEKATKFESDGTEEESTLLFMNITAGVQIAL